MGGHFSTQNLNPDGSWKNLTEQKARDVTQALIDNEEKDRRDKHENKRHDRGHHGLTTRWPNDLRHFCAHLLQKREWICSCHGKLSSQEDSR